MPMEVTIVEEIFRINYMKWVLKNHTMVTGKGWQES